MQGISEPPLRREAGIHVERRLHICVLCERAAVLCSLLMMEE
jgi:hypothetical protein